MNGHAKWEYIIHITNDIRKNFYEVKTLKDTWDFATDWKPVYRSKRKQEVIELCNALNRLEKANLCNASHQVYNSRRIDKIDTKRYTFVRDGYGKWKLESYKQDTPTKNLIEVIHRRDEKIEDLERKLHEQNFEVIRYQIIAKKLYDKLHAIPETDLYWTLIKEAGLENEELCDMVHAEMEKKGVK